MKTFANHAHVFHGELRPAGTVDKLKETMDAVGLDMAVAYAPFNKNGSIQVLSPDEDQNLWLAEELRGQSDIVGFGTVNFDRPDLEDQVKHIADLGLKGIKIHPQHQQVRINGEKAYRVYRTAEELGLFLSFHTGVHYDRMSEYSVLMFDDLAWDFPKLHFSMEHIGGWSFFREAVAVMTNQRDTRRTPRVFAGWTSIFERGHWYVSPEQLLELMTFTGEKCHIFGLDFPYHDAAYIAAGMRCIRALPISDEAKELILGGNLARELGL